jgi:hypothetical protein
MDLRILTGAPNSPASMSLSTVDRLQSNTAITLPIDQSRLGSVFGVSLSLVMVASFGDDHSLIIRVC